MSTPASTTPPQTDLSAPIKTVQEAATGFSTDALAWIENSTQHALLALAIIVGVVLSLQMLRRGLLYLLGGKLGVPRSRLGKILYRFIRATSVLFVSLLGCWLTAQFINLPRGVLSGLSLAFMIVGFIQVGLWLREALLLLIELRLTKQGALAPDTSLGSALGVIGWLVNLGVWSIVLMLLLDNLGVNITALIAGLGIGGLAVGLAAQGIMADLFSALSIVFDKPFVRGDFIVFNDKLGTVERVGLKTSRLRALSGEMIVVANNQLLGSVIHNYQQMLERRVVFNLGITYDATPEKVELAQKIIREAVAEDPNCRLDRAHFTGYGDSSLNFEAVYYFKGRDYTPYMDAHQAILLRIMRGFAAAGIEFAFPTRTVHLINDAA